MENIKLMLGIDLNVFWRACFNYFTPIFSILILIITASSNNEVKLGEYVYPWWAHLIGWFIVAIIVTPFIKFAISSMIEGGIFRVNFQSNA